MTVEDIDKVDRLAFNRTNGDVLLVISDHLDWDENEGERAPTGAARQVEYLFGVCRKRSTLRQVSSRSREKNNFLCGGKFPLSDEASNLYRLAGKAIHDYGCSLQFVHHKPGEALPIGAGET
jgi:hypothetical protein